MAQQNFNTSFPNDGLGDQLRAAFIKQQAMNTELYSTKVDKVVGKGLSDNNFTTALKDKLDGLNASAEPNVQSDWNELDPTSDAFILGKPIFSTSEIIVSAIWTGTGLNFDVSADAFPINGVSYPATPDTVTLDAADATLDRIDLIVAIKPTLPATVGTVGKITGTPASTALVVPPDYDPSLYYVIKQVSVLAAATEPDGAVNTVIYDEGVEWVVSYAGANISQTANDPSSGAVSLEAVNCDFNDRMFFEPPAPMSTSEIDLLEFDLKLKEEIINKYFSISFHLGSLRFGTKLFKSPKFDDENLSYQTIQLTKAELNLPIQNFDKIEIYFSTNLIDGYFFDNFKLYKGSGAETVPDTGIPEAPINGTLYGRKNAAWEAIPAAAADMSKSVYDPTNVEGDAFDMENMKVASGSKTTPIDADSIVVWDSTGTPVFKKLTWANLKATLKTYFDTIYAPKFGTRITNASVTTTYTLNHNAANDWKLTLTGNTTFSDSNLPTGTNTKEFTIKMTGAFTPTFPAYWGTVQGDAYDGASWNFYTVQIHNGTAASEEFTVFNTVLT